jgi:hypothetical protein
VILDISDLGPVEQYIVTEGIKRLRDGVAVYGVWDLSTKDNFYEQVMEVLDRNHYLDAEKLKDLKRAVAFLERAVAEDVRRERGKDQADGPTAQT